MSTGADEAWPHRQLLITHRLRQRRSDLGLTQHQVVARLAEHGLQTTNRALSSLEHGAGLDVAKLPALAAALDCTVTYLIGLTDDPRRWEPDPAEPPRRTATAGAARAEATTGPADELATELDGEMIARPSLILGADVPDRGARLTLDTRVSRSGQDAADDPA
jgi:transcriptional regulator with XRE-family HTH domain